MTVWAFVSYFHHLHSNQLFYWGYGDVGMLGMPRDKLLWCALKFVIHINN
jgi:hypothetical protein